MAAGPDQAFDALLQAIADGDAERAFGLIEHSPGLATAAVQDGATRAQPRFVAAIGHHIYAGDTALHIAAAAHRPDMARRLIAAGADVRARNRRGAEPLHYAADGSPGAPVWDPAAQAATIAALIGAGGDPNAANQDGTTPLHRAVRTRSATAVQVLLDAGADPHRQNKSGSNPVKLAGLTAGRSGSGSDAAKAQQAEIVGLLARFGTAS